MAQAIGGIAGAAIGFVASGGNPVGAQWGWVIGAAVGTSFTTIQQPRIGDLAAATAGEGGARARVYGQFRPIGGQVVWAGRAREIRRRQRQGKGGPRVETSTILRSYAIGICEGPITGVTRIWRNNELVYDVRPGSAMLAESAQWLRSKTLSLGGWAQLPHPTIEAEVGAANAPAMRGTALLVVTDENLTDVRGAIPAYQFEVFSGRQVFTTPLYPVEVIEELASTAAIMSGSFTHPPLDEIVSTGVLLSGDLRTPLFSYSIPPEALDTQGAVLSGNLITLLRTYNNYAPEALDTQGAVLSGDLRTLLITYNNYAPEAVDSSGAIISGVLT